MRVLKVPSILASITLVTSVLGAAAPGPATLINVAERQDMDCHKACDGTMGWDTKYGCIENCNGCAGVCKGTKFADSVLYWSCGNCFIAP